MQDNQVAAHRVARLLGRVYSNTRVAGGGGDGEGGGGEGSMAGYWVRKKLISREEKCGR